MTRGARGKWYMVVVVVVVVMVVVGGNNRKHTASRPLASQFSMHPDVNKQTSTRPT